MNRKLSLISPELGELLVKQIAHELKNYILYRSYANYFSIEGITDLETYYLKRSDEEQVHHDWIKTYLTDGDYKFKYPAIEQNEEVWDDYIKPFTQTIDREILTTQMIYAIYELAISQKDYMMVSWLQEKLIKEQIEEENTSRMAKMIMEESANIFVKASKVLNLL